MSKTKAVVLSFFILLLGLSGGLLGARLVMPKYPKVLCGNFCQNTVTSDRKFFADTLVISGQTGPDGAFLLYLDLNRKKVGSSFQHYYFADFIYKGQHRQLYTSFLNPDPAVKPSDFLKSFSVRQAEDLSARESYSLTFVYKDLSVSADIQNFQGDYLVKNNLEYTKYVSEQDANVNLNGSSLSMHGFLQKIYTPDYAKYVFFEGYNELNSLAQFFVLWDKQGNFYLLDTSDVKSSQPEYKSHTWVLYKKRDGQLLKKAFSAQVEADQSGWVPKGWAITLPDIKARLALSPQAFFSTKMDSGLAAGTVNTGSGESAVSGYFSFQKYGR